ncbi:unnamed protein product [Closterium sp. NIES-65]|nr:unnamed protein product [Closterium sp. NIES-65]
MEYLRLFRQRTAEFRALGGEALVGGKRAESGGEGGREAAPLNPLLVPYIDLNIAPLRRIYAWAVPTEAALAAFVSTQKSPLFCRLSASLPLRPSVSAGPYPQRLHWQL